MENWVNTRVGGGELEFIGNISNFFLNWIWPIKFACKLLIGSFEHNLFSVGMSLQKHQITDLKFNVSVFGIDLLFHSIICCM